MWQVIYDELKPLGLQIIAVALDTGGAKAVESRIRPPDLDAVPRPRAWADEHWNRRSLPTFPCLIDEKHEVADLYGMVNIPMAVWIDEAGKIVRPAEPAGAGDEWRQEYSDSYAGMPRQDSARFQLPDVKGQAGIESRLRYLGALRDWVRHGAESRYALSAEKVRQRVAPPDADDLRAATHIRLAHHLFAGGHADAAERHVREAVRLCPDKWNYRRQSLVLDEENIGRMAVQPEFWKAMEELGDAPYHRPLDL